MATFNQRTNGAAVVDGAVAPPARQIASLLEQLAGVVEGLTDDQYLAAPARGVSGSVGGHTRHCLDHVAALVAGLTTRCIGYDARARGTAVERRRDAAAAEARRLAGEITAIRQSRIDDDMFVALRLDAAAPELVVRSTLARELTFVASHTVHHFAIVALLLRDLGVGVPPRFGYAPSTPSPGLAA